MITVPITPPRLEGSTILLAPLERIHIDGLCAIGLDPELWEFTVSLVRNREDMVRYVEEALRQQQAGTALPFVIADRRTSAVLGCTRYGNIDRRNGRVEIGWTWIGREWQKTVVNTEAKYLLLRHAFESIGCVRVEFKTDALNLRSRSALKRIGAKEEGVLRRHMVTDTGRLRDTVYFSILREEWPGAKVALEERSRYSEPGKPPKTG